jgi:periplasmic protein CpxP/Spy
MLFRHFSILIPVMAIAVGSTSIALADSFPKINSVSEPILAQTNKRQERRSRFLEELNLSEEQKRQLNEIQQKYKEQISENRQKVSSLRKELLDMMSGTASANSIRAQHNEIAQLQQIINNLRFESMLEMREVLNPDQRQKFTSLMQQRWQQRRDRMQNR